MVSGLKKLTAQQGRLSKTEMNSMAIPGSLRTHTDPDVRSVGGAWAGWGRLREGCSRRGDSICAPGGKDAAAESWGHGPSAVILEPRKIKSDTPSTVSPSVSHEVMGLDAMIFIF